MNFMEFNMPIIYIKNIRICMPTLLAYITVINIHLVYSKKFPRAEVHGKYSYRSGKQNYSYS